MIHHIYNCNLSWGEELRIFVFGDLQWGQDGFVKEAWQEFKREFKASKNALAIGLGDYGDWLRPSMRSRVYGSMSGDDSARIQLDDMYNRTQDKLLDEMEFLKGKIVGLHMGHHTHEYLHGGNADMRICSALKTKYLGWIASTRLVIKNPQEAKLKGNRTKVITILSMHGTGSARHATTDSRWLEVNIVPAFQSDVYLKGHGCKSVSWIPFERQVVRRRGPVGLNKELPRCLNVGGFSQGYTNGFTTSYVEKSGFAPQPLGWGEIRICRTGKNPQSKETRKSGGGFLKVEHLIKNYEP